MTSSRRTIAVLFHPDLPSLTWRIPGCGVPTKFGNLYRRDNQAMHATRTFFCNFFLALFVLLTLLPMPRVHAAPPPPSDPWAGSQLVQPADFARELAGKKTPPPTIVYVGVRTLYQGAHIPGALFHGASSSEQGRAELKKWAAELPRSTNLVIYCGCCPFDHCPNIRPAFIALRDMGFTHLRVLALPADFATDWIAKGYPIEKGM